MPELDMQTDEIKISDRAVSPTSHNGPSMTNLFELVVSFQNQVLVSK